MKYFAMLSFFLCLHLNALASQSFERTLLNFNIDKRAIADFKMHQHLVVHKVKDLSEREDELRLKLYIADTNQIFILSKTTNGDVTLEDTGESFEFELKTFEGKIANDLYQTILSDTNSEVLARTLSRAFEAEFSNTKKLRANAYYQFSVETITEENGESDFGLIEKAKLIVGKASVEKESLFDLDSETSVLVNKAPLHTEKIFTSPVISHRVSSLFNLHRKHPITRRIQPHNGIDFVAHSGTPVFPALEGRIVAIARAKAKGKFILIDHGNGFLSTYDHLRKFQKGLRVGDYVSTKDQIGEVGKTGYATGAHLHFAVLKDGLFVNPLHYFKDVEVEGQTMNEPEISLPEIDLNDLWKSRKELHHHDIPYYQVHT